ncbi:MAG: membrane protein insertion efficiency factor YidD [Clostridia bacterium]|nr:membrane protein insertion efficiency factor YidD [Clostridia bacterium]
MKHLCIWMVRFYKKFLSPLKGKPCCRFVPTCSSYAIEAFQKRGFFVGMILTVWRIMRCNPFCPGGYDPVPEKGFRYKGPRVMPIDSEQACCEECGEPRREDDGGGHQEALDDKNTASCKENGEV